MGSPQNGKVALALVQAYELLADLHHPAGAVYAQHADRLKNVLAMRNHSLMAHGFTPVSQADFEKAAERIEAFVIACDRAQENRFGFETTRQFPQRFDLEPV